MRESSRFGKESVNIIKLVQEFARYVLVGGSAFIVDSSILYLFREYIFYNLDALGIYISVVFGFIGGLLYNYIFSMIFVFRDLSGEKTGLTANTFYSFALIGIVGLVITELGIYLGVEELGFHYLSVKATMAAIVLIWNYVGRKILLIQYIKIRE